MNAVKLCAGYPWYLPLCLGCWLLTFQEWDKAPTFSSWHPQVLWLRVGQFSHQILEMRAVFLAFNVLQECILDHMVALLSNNAAVVAQPPAWLLASCYITEWAAVLLEYTRNLCHSHFCQMQLHSYCDELSTATIPWELQGLRQISHSLSKR